MDKIILELIRIYNAHNESILFITGFAIGVCLVWFFISIWRLFW